MIENIKDYLKYIIFTFVVVFLAIMLAKLPEKQAIKNIAIYKQRLSDKDFSYIKTVCYTDLNCWNRERAILSGMQVKTECHFNPATKMSECKEHYYYNGTDIHH